MSFRMNLSPTYSFPKKRGIKFAQGEKVYWSLQEGLTKNPETLYIGVIAEDAAVDSIRAIVAISDRRLFGRVKNELHAKEQEPTL